jgi:transposase
MLSLRTPEQRVPTKHPLRAIKTMVDEALEGRSGKFDEMYSAVGRPSIPPEHSLKGSLLQALYSIRSERQLCKQLDYILLYRWFLDMGADDETFNHSTFSANRERFMRHEVEQPLFKEVISQAKAKSLLSPEHFSVDGTLVAAAASLKSFRPKDEKPEDRPPPDDPGNPTVNFHGEKRVDETHDDGSGGAPGAQVERDDGEAQLLPQRDEREPQRLAGGPVPHGGFGHGRARWRAEAHRRVRPRGPANHSRSGQGVRHEGLRRSVTTHERDTARREEEAERTRREVRRDTGAPPQSAGAEAD